jgi:hypothetical protein
MGRAEQGPALPQAAREPTAREFFAQLASDRALPVHSGGDTRPTDDLSPAELAAAARLVAPLFGDRPLGGLTLGELAELPALLESSGMGPDASRQACRALGNALRSAIIALPDSRSPS